MEVQDNKTIFKANKSAAPDIPECLELIALNGFMGELLNADHYVAKSEYINRLSDYKETVDFFNVLKKSGMLESFCERNNLVFATVSNTLDKYNCFELLIDNRNNLFVERKMIEEKEYLDGILKESDPDIILDDDQRKVVLTDEDYCLVIAGAGAGKTTTVAAKVKYLVEKKNVDPKKILVISYTNKAVNELKQRIIGELHIECPIATFHSTGNAILHKQNPETLNIADSSKLYYVIQDYLKGTALQNESSVNNLILFFATYFDAPNEGSDLKSFFNNIAKANYTTMRSELDEYERTVIDTRTKKSVTIQSESLRSNQEVEIANFLYLNNIDYEYEPLYPFNIYYARKPYTPDFIIRQGDKTAYIEHFGITEDGRNDRYSAAQLAAYKKAINDKILLHKQHDTTLIYTFSAYKDRRPLLEHLQESLEEKGFILSPRSNKEVLEKLVSSEENKYIRKFVSLIQRFISNFKVNGYTEDEFNRMYHSTQNVRTRLFLDICNDCYLEYQRYLKENNAVDFEDMINESARLLREVEEMKQKLDFDYVIVDEYQDISRQRFDLVSALHKVTDAKIVAVGDDWQSIYAFSGSDITLFTKFAEKMGYAKLLKIVRTYRNSQEVIDIAGTFIQKNKEQIQKDLISPKNITDPVIIYTYDSSKKEKNGDNRSGANYAIAHAVEVAIEQIIKYNKDEGKPMDSSILLLGRYGFDGDRLERSGLFQYVTRGSKIKSVKYPRLNITFMTAHSSKGLGYDNVIVVNGRNETYGFPSKIEDDPVLAFVIKGDRSIDYAEERRLFYVAMTRTKNRVFFIAPEQNPSEFLLEIKHDFRNVVLRGDWNDNPEKIPNYKKTCPMCGYPMQFRYKQSMGLRLYICTNEPEVCGFMTNDYGAGKLGICKCDLCRDGYLIIKRPKGRDYFLGCTNFKADKTGCSGSMTRKMYYEKLGITDEIPATPVIFPNGSKIAPQPTTKTVDEKSTEKPKVAKPISEPAVIKAPDIKTVYYNDINLNDTILTILQCLSDISQYKFRSSDVLTEVLTGTDSETVIKDRLNTCEEYGALSKLKRDDVKFIIDWLIKNHFALRTKEAYPVLHPTYEGVHLDETLSVKLLHKLAREMFATEDAVNIAVNPKYPENLLADLMYLKGFERSGVRSNFAKDVDRRLGEVLSLYPTKVKEILISSYNKKESNFVIGARYGVSAESIQRIINRNLSRLRRKSHLDYLCGKTDELPNRKYVTVGIRDAAEMKKACDEFMAGLDVSKFRYSTNKTLTLTDISQRINELNSNENLWEVNYKLLAQWLTADGMLIQHKNNRGFVKYFPSAKGKENGIDIEDRTYKSNTVKVVGYNITAQKYIVQNIDRLFLYLFEAEQLQDK